MELFSDETGTFLLVASLFAVISPLVISFVKNMGFTWPEWLKNVFAVIMALIGSFIAYGTAAGWTDIPLGDFNSFWLPLIVGMVLVFAEQLAAYSGFWKPEWNGLETEAALLGQPHN